MMRTYLLFSLLVFILNGGSAALSSAQPNVCPALVESALQSVGDNCSGISRNGACYGFNHVEATFSQTVEEGYFSEPSDRAELTYLQTLRTAPLDPDTGEWGIALMNVQANVPTTLPGQAVVFILIGDVQVENAVAPEQVFVPADPIHLTTASGSNLRSAPSLNASVVASVPAGTPLDADGRSADGEWLRVVYQEQPQWISRQGFDGADGIDSLPLLSADQLTPMQAFYFSTGTGFPRCNEAPDSLLIQGPQNMTVTINANGADVTIGSTVLLRTPSQESMQVISVQGHAIVEGLVIPGGFTVSAPLDEQRTVQPGTWAGFRPLTQDELDSLQSLANIAPQLLNYTIRPPTMADILQVQSNLSAGVFRQAVAERCREAGLTEEQCRLLFDDLSDLERARARCLEAGFTLFQCRQILGEGEMTIEERCRLLGFDTPEECREAFSGATDRLQQLCLNAGYSSAQECLAAFPTADSGWVERCLEEGYTTEDSCRAAHSEMSTSSASGGSSQIDERQRRCQEAGVSQQQCQYFFSHPNIPAPQRCQNAGISPQQCYILVNG